jgi:hypothetical protein
MIDATRRRDSGGWIATAVLARSVIRSAPAFALVAGAHHPGVLEE